MIVFFIFQPRNSGAVVFRNTAALTTDSHDNATQDVSTRLLEMVINAARSLAV